MAKKALEKLEEQLNCSICLDTYTDPKQLQCHHVYCRQCLVHLVVRDRQGQTTLTCPTCRQVTPVPASGVPGLQSAFHINHLLEIRDSVKHIQDPGIIAEEGAVERGPAEVSPAKVSYCSDHKTKEAELYCETCEELVCVKCVISGGKHSSHLCKELAEACEEYKGKILLSLKPVEKQLTTIKTALAQLDACCGEISDQRAAIEADIHTTVGRLHQVLDTRKTELIKQLHDTTQAKLKQLAVQRDQLETIQAQLSSCLEYTQESFKTANYSEVLKRKTSVAKQVKELTTAFQPAMLEPNTKADVIFSVPADLTATCKSYGLIVTASELAQRQKWQTTGVGLQEAVAGEISQVKVMCVDSKGQPYDSPIQSLQWELVSTTQGTIIQGKSKRKGRSDYDINYRPIFEGKHQLYIQVSGQNIEGSPFSVAVKSPKKLRTPLFTISGLNGPAGVTFNHRRELVVAESAGRRVSTYSQSGTKLGSFGTRGSGPGQIERPFGVAIDRDGNILIADHGNHRIQKYASHGKFLGAIGQSRFHCPLDVAYNPSNSRLYVVDATENVKVLNSDLTFCSKFGKPGNNIGEFQRVRGIACDHTGKVYVADSGNHRIQVFTAEGRFVREIGRQELKCPVGVAVDTRGQVYVSDAGSSKVSVFTNQGECVDKFGDKGNGPGQFKVIHGLTVDNRGVVYACDVAANCIQVFNSA